MVTKVCILYCHLYIIHGCPRDGFFPQWIIYDVTCTFTCWQPAEVQGHKYKHGAISNWSMWLPLLLPQHLSAKIVSTSSTQHATLWSRAGWPQGTRPCWPTTCARSSTSTWNYWGTAGPDVLTTWSGTVTCVLFHLVQRQQENYSPLRPNEGSWASGFPALAMQKVIDIYKFRRVPGFSKRKIISFIAWVLLGLEPFTLIYLVPCSTHW